MPHSATLSSRQRRALAQMGIDLWVRRGVPNAAATSPAEAPPPTANLTDLRGEQAAVQLECLAANGAVIVGGFVSPADRRFAQDVLFALCGFGAAITRTEFRWPQTQTADSGPNAARSAYAGFLRGQTERAGARCLLMFGDAASALFDPASASAFDGCTVLHVADAKALRGDAAQKKTLWLTISHLTCR